MLTCGAGRQQKPYTHTHGVGADVPAFVGTAAYLAPEALKAGPMATARDLWALGVALFGLLSARSAFDKGVWPETRRAIKHWCVPLGSLPSGVSIDARELIVRLLAKEPDARPTARDLLECDPFVCSGCFDSS